MRLIDADALKQHIDKLPALPDGNFAGNHSALKALINMQPTIEPSTNCSEFPNNSDTISRQAAIDAINQICPIDTEYDCTLLDRVDIICVLKDLPSAQPDLSEYSDKLWRNAYERGKRDALEESQWIPCSDRLPKKEQECIVCRNGIIRIDKFIGRDIPCKWNLTISDYEAWMPLPDPYKGE